LTVLSIMDGSPSSGRSRHRESVFALARLGQPEQAWIAATTSVDPPLRRG